jgi:3-hydroxyisobutyrate dehydrogenase
MVAGDPDVVAGVRPLLDPLASAVHECGAVPNALRMKLAVNLFLITLVTGLAESFHLASRLGLDTERFAAIIDAGQMSSAVSRIKVAKMLERDFDAQAAVADVLWNAELVAAAARGAGLSTPLLDDAHQLFAEAVSAGNGHLDMAAVLTALEGRSTDDTTA